MTLKEIYTKLKKGEITLENDCWCDYITIGESTRRPDNGKQYIFYARYGASAMTVSYRNFADIVHRSFNCSNAKQLLKHFNKALA